MIRSKSNIGSFCISKRYIFCSVHGATGSMESAVTPWPSNSCCCSRNSDKSSYDQCQQGDPAITGSAEARRQQQLLSQISILRVSRDTRNTDHSPSMTCSMGLQLQQSWGAIRPRPSWSAVRQGAYLTRHDLRPTTSTPADVSRYSVACIH